MRPSIANDVLAEMLRDAKRDASLASDLAQALEQLGHVQAISSRQAEQLRAKDEIIAALRASLRRHEGGI